MSGCTSSSSDATTGVSPRLVSSSSSSSSGPSVSRLADSLRAEEVEAVVVEAGAVVEVGVEVEEGRPWASSARLGTFRDISAPAEEEDKESWSGPPARGEEER